MVRHREFVQYKLNKTKITETNVDVEPLIVDVDLKLLMLMPPK